MKTKMFLSLLLLATVVPGALAAADEAETKAHSRSDPVLVSPVEDPAVTNVVSNTAIVPNDPKQVLQDYNSPTCSLNCSACGVESKNRTWREFRMLKQNRTQR